LYSLFLLTLFVLKPAFAESRYKDVYLTHQRICEQCEVVYVSRTRVRLRNKDEQVTFVHSHEIIGVDEHPIKRKITDHFVDNLNPHAAKVLYPDLHYGAHNDLYGNAHPQPPTQKWWH